MPFLSRLAARSRRSRSISSVYSLMSARFVSFWLTSGLLVMLLARCAYSSVLMVSSRLHDAGEMVAMMDVLVRPPSESCSSRVSLLSLKPPSLH